jgi:hypothetical protein
LRRILAERGQEQGQEQGRPPLHPDTLILAEKDQEPGHPPLHPDTSISAERDQEQGCPPLHPDTRILAERDQGQGHPPLHPDTQMLPFHIVGPSSSASVSGIAPGQPNPIDDITVSVVDSTNCCNMTWFHCAESNIDDKSIIYMFCRSSLRANSWPQCSAACCRLHMGKCTPKQCTVWI